MSQLMLVGNDEDIRDIYLPALKEAGHDVSWVPDSCKAADAARKQKPALILVAEQNGRYAETVRTVAQSDSCRDVPIVVMTSFSPLDVMESHILGLPSVRRCVFKPCRPKTFLEAIEDVLCFT